MTSLTSGFNRSFFRGELTTSEFLLPTGWLMKSDMQMGSVWYTADMVIIQFLTVLRLQYNHYRSERSTGIPDCSLKKPQVPLAAAALSLSITSRSGAFTESTETLPKITQNTVHFRVHE